MPIDRRCEAHARLPLRVPAVAEPAGTAADPALGEAQNLSQGGVALRLKNALGAPVRVTLRLRPGLLLTLAGTVVWIRPDPDLPGWALGIRFSEELPGEMVAGIASETHPPLAAPPR